MPKKKRWAIIVILLVYLVAGVGIVRLCAPSTPQPTADEQTIAAFVDSLRTDSITKRHESKRDSLRQALQAENERREQLRQHRRDSAQHHWDSVRQHRDSVKAQRDSIHHALKTHEPHSIDLATADATTLCRVPGIGMTTAQRIVTRRTRLGGYHSVEQVLETEGVSIDVLTYLTLSTTEVQRININRASTQSLRSHPYVNGEQAYAILDSRRKYGTIEGWHQLLRLAPFTPADTLRLAPYFTF